MDLSDSRTGATIRSISRTQSSLVPDSTRPISEYSSPTSSLSANTALKLVPKIAGLRADRTFIFSLGHIYKSLAVDSLAKGSPSVQEQVAPTEYGLSQCYPNPFNPSTRIQFSLPTGTNLTLGVYDVLGREVATLANGYYAAGVHSVVWNATSASSGVYYARLTVMNGMGKTSFNKASKLLLVK